jgi:hypothetical protein
MAPGVAHRAQIEALSVCARRIAGAPPAPRARVAPREVLRPASVAATLLALALVAMHAAAGSFGRDPSLSPERLERDERVLAALIERAHERESRAPIEDPATQDPPPPRPALNPSPWAHLHLVWGPWVCGPCCLYPLECPIWRPWDCTPVLASPFGPGCFRDPDADVPWPGPPGEWVIAPTIPMPQDAARPRLLVPRVSGALPVLAVQRVVRRGVDALTRCYGDALVRSPTVRGTLTTRFVIAADGSVMGAATLENDARNPQLGVCVAQVIRRMQFPGDVDGRVTVVNYPMALRPPS